MAIFIFLGVIFILVCISAGVKVYTKNKLKDIDGATGVTKSSVADGQKIIGGIMSDDDK